MDVQNFQERIKFLSSDEIQNFIIENENIDPQKLILNPSSLVKEHVIHVADQIISRKKAKTKHPLWYTTKGVVYPPPLSLEQSSADEVAQYKKHFVKNNQIIDLTGGMGVDLINMSNSESLATYLEKDPWIASVFEHNAIKLGRHIEILNMPCESYLDQISQGSFVFIDPARRNDSKNKVFKFQDCSPNVIELIPSLLERGCTLLIKASPMIDVTLGIKEIAHVSEVHVVSSKGDCKEVLFLLTPVPKNDPQIHCIDLSANSEFIFTMHQEHSTHVPLCEPKKYLLDPNPSILKAGAFKTIADRFKLCKLDVNTHLYTADEIIQNFPGRQFEVIHANVSKREIKNLITDGQVNVISKNYPGGAAGLKKKFSLKDGGQHFLIGLKSVSANKLMFCSKV
ncbi:MAG: hypothetical protein JXQ90_11030 [Cyclobacteriaceae bacterium]